MQQQQKSYAIDTVYDATNDRILASIARVDLSAIAMTFILNFSDANPNATIVFISDDLIADTLVDQQCATPFDLMIHLLAIMRQQTTSETEIPYHIETFAL